MWLKTEYFPRLLISLHREVYGQMSPWSQSSGVTGVSLLGLCWASEPGILWKCVYSISPASGRFGLGLSWKIFHIFRFYKDLKVCKACTLIKKSDSFSWSWNKPSTGSMGNSGAWTHPPTLKLMSFRATLVSPDFPLFLSWSDHRSDLCSVLKQNEFIVQWEAHVLRKLTASVWIWVLYFTSCLPLGTFASVSSLVIGENLTFFSPYCED